MPSVIEMPFPTFHRPGGTNVEQLDDSGPELGANTVSAAAVDVDAHPINTTNLVG
jgi:hypothetical protein